MDTTPATPDPPPPPPRAPPPPPPPACDPAVSADPVSAVSKPDKPIMGDLVPLSKDYWSAWTGGKPLADWS